MVVGTNPSFPLFLRKCREYGYDVRFVSFQETHSESRIKGIITHEIKLNFNRANPLDKLLKSLLFLVVTPLIVRRIHRENPLDLVYCDDSFPFYAPLIKKIARTCTIMRLGDLQSAYIFAGRGLLKRLIFRLVFHFERRLWGSMDRLVAISQDFKEFLARSGISPSKIAVVPESIDLESFKSSGKKGSIRARYRIGSSPLVMFHGLVARVKGLDVLLRAVPEILREVPTTKFMIVGDGSDLKRLQRMVTELGVTENIILTGWVPFSEIPDYLHECNVGVPLRSANLGNNFVVTSALLQYWAMQKPVVAPHLAAISRIISGRNGLLFTPEDPLDLAKKVVYLLQHPDEAAQMGIEGRSTASELFNIESVAQAMVDVLLELCPRDRVKHPSWSITT